MDHAQTRTLLSTVVAGAFVCFASLTLASPAAAASCGLVGTPSACSVSVGGVINYTFSNFQFVGGTTAGGGIAYGGNDISIDLVSSGGLTAALTFAKSASSPGTVFLANAGETTGFTFSYLLTATALVPGTIDFTSTTTSYVQSFFQNGSSSVQQIVAGQVNCMVISSNTTNVCPVTGSGPLSVGNIVTLVGNTGNTSILQFRNVFDASFTPATPGGTPVPEPASLLLVAVGLAGAGVLRRRTR